MAWFKNVALFLFAVTPYVTARPLKTVRGCSVLDVEALEPEAKYIVTLHNNITPSEFKSHIAKVNVTYHRNSLNDEQNRPSGVERTYAIGGYRAYSGVFDKDTIALLWNDTDVEEIERDEYFTIQRKLVTQRHAPWGLAALSGKKPGAKSYRYDKSAGNGTFAYVVDSGIFTKHEEFGGRATVRYSIDPSNLSDVNGHGTHVAGIIAGKTFGVAKQAELIGVKVFFNNGGYISDVLDGFQWAVQDIVLKSRESRSVINMSVGGPYSLALNRAVDAAFELGILSVVAAGNEASPARFTSPASAPNALTVGAIDIEWNSCRFSNFGPEVNIQAPGLQIESAFIATVNATATLSGTSMAAPHVAGLALYLAVLEKTVDARHLRDVILELARGGKVKDLESETPNVIAHNGAR
ncbi:peptidase S8/S53 domain-containing protein [Trichoderma compactum]